jgi:hypothetical protein
MSQWPEMCERIDHQAVTAKNSQRMHRVISQRRFSMYHGNYGIVGAQAERELKIKRHQFFFSFHSFSSKKQLAIICRFLGKRGIMEAFLKFWRD